MSPQLYRPFQYKITFRAECPAVKQQISSFYTVKQQLMVNEFLSYLPIQNPCRVPGITPIFLTPNITDLNIEIYGCTRWPRVSMEIETGILTSLYTLWECQQHLQKARIIPSWHLECHSNDCLWVVNHNQEMQWSSPPSQLSTNPVCMKALPDILWSLKSKQSTMVSKSKQEEQNIIRAVSSWII